VIVGGGKVGYYLARTLWEKQHQVSVVERDAARAAQLAQQLPVLVIAGDGTDTTRLADAGADRAEVLAAVTGLDEVNLVACQIAHREFGVRRTIARVNNPKNQTVLQELGVDIAVSSTAMISQLVERETHLDGLRELLTFQKGNVALVETRLEAASPAAGRAIWQLAPDLPGDSVLVAVVRGDQVIFPRGGTVLEEDDLVIALASAGTRDALTLALIGRGGEG
jgi:trk system potassium uptake protein TrkA